MSFFSIALDEFMKRKKISNREVTEFTGIKSPTFYKIRKGDRFPAGREDVIKIANALQLSRFDQDKLLEAYQIDLIGPYKYHGYDVIRKFLRTDFDGIPDIKIPLEYTPKPLNLETTVFQGTGQVYSALFYMFSGKSDRILICQNGRDDTLLNILRQIMIGKHETDITHIFMFDDDTSSYRKDNPANIQFFGEVFKTILEIPGYRPRYFYGSMTTDRSIENLNSFILSSDLIMKFSGSYKYAIIHKGEAVRDLYKKIAEDYLTATNELIRIADQAYFTGEEILLNPGEIMLYSAGLCTPVILRPEDQFLETHLKEDYPGKEDFIRNYEEKYLRMYQGSFFQDSKVTLIVEKNPITFAINKGLFPEFLFAYSIPMNVEEKANMIKRWIWAKGKIDFRLHDDPNIPGQSSLTILSTPNMSIITLLRQTDGFYRHLVVREKSIVTMFFDFFKDLKEKCLSDEEEREFYDSLLNQLKKEII